MKHLLALLSLLTFPVFAAEPQPLPANGAVVFKNGLAFVTREGTLPFKAGEARLTPAPSALLGTLWISAAGRPLDEVRAAKETRETQQAATTIAALLEANIGRTVTVRIGDREYTGTIVKPPADVTPEPRPIPRPSIDPYGNITHVVPVPESLLLLDVGGRVHVFERAAVQSVSFAQSPLTTRAVSTTEATLTLRAKGLEGRRRSPSATCAAASAGCRKSPSRSSTTSAPASRCRPR
ncbi:MAG TPA: hypothetical protein VF618_16090 [Thermoanaerobaculia bacterium]